MLAIKIFSEVHTGSEITWLLWVALGFFALMVIVGWLVSRKNSPGEGDHPGTAGHLEKDEDNH